MQFDRAQLDKLLSMDDESFASLTRAIAEAAGADKAKTEMLLSNPDFLKKQLARVSPDDAKKLIDSAGREKSEEIMQMLRERGVDLGQ